ncbi:MAG: hypothetical protein ABH863_06410 [Candidatus Micrarchaeota archaeon]
MYEHRKGADTVHDYLASSLYEHARKMGVPEKYAKKVDLLFRHSLIVPSVKHPKQIMGRIHNLLNKPGRKNNPSDSGLLRLVDLRLSHDKQYWNAMKVWSTPRMPHQRSAFNKDERAIILSKLSQIK